jgi:RNA polymerase primary sigma factor
VSGASGFRNSSGGRCLGHILPDTSDDGDLTLLKKHVAGIDDRLVAVVERLGSWIENDSVDGARLERVLVDVGADEHISRAVWDMLTAAGISVVGERAVPPAPPKVRPPAPRSEPADRQADAVSAARRLLELDRWMRRLDRRILKAEEEVGLSLLLRGPRSRALEQGAFADLAGERREAAEAMVLHNLRLVHKIAMRYGGQGLDHDELTQSGMIGLIRAVELFDPDAGFKFSTYATWWIRQAITRAIADLGRVVRIPVHMHEVIQRVRALQERLTVDDVGPSPARLAAECHLTVEKVIECLRLSRSTASLDAEIGEDGFTLGDLIDEQADRREHVEVNGFYPEDVWGWLAVLKERERDVLLRRYGLAPYEDPETLDAVGQAYGVTRERARQIQSKAFANLIVAANNSPAPGGSGPLPALTTQ